MHSSQIAFPVKYLFMNEWAKLLAAIRPQQPLKVRFALGRHLFVLHIIVDVLPPGQHLGVCAYLAVNGGQVPCLVRLDHVTGSNHTAIHHRTSSMPLTRECIHTLPETIKYDYPHLAQGIRGASAGVEEKLSTAAVDTFSKLFKHECA